MNEPIPSNVSHALARLLVGNDLPTSVDTAKVDPPWRSVLRDVWAVPLDDRDTVLNRELERMAFTSREVRDLRQAFSRIDVTSENVIPRFPSFTLAELLSKKFPPPIWAVPGLIPQGLSMLAGKPKGGKSYLMLQICMGIAHGGFVLGNTAVECGDVLYVDMENGEEVLQERAIDALHGQRCPANFYCVTDAPRLDEGCLEFIEQWMVDHPATRIIVLDTFEAIRPLEKGDRGNSNAFRSDYAALRPLADLSKRVRVAIVVIHHIAKREVDDIFAAINGSYGINASVDNLMVLGQKGNEVILAAKGRRVRPTERALNWDQDTAQWTDQGEATEVHQSSERREVIGILRDAGQSLTPKEFSERCDRTYTASKKLLWSMARDGELIAANGRYSAHPKARENSGNFGNPGNSQEKSRVTFGQKDGNPDYGVPRTAPVTAQNGRQSNANGYHPPERIRDLAAVGVTPVTRVTGEPDPIDPNDPEWRF